MSSLHTKTKFISGDEVVVIAGKDLGKRGTLQKILKGNKAIVTGLNLVKKHTKPNPQMGITGGIVEQEAAIAISNLAIWNPKKKKADRIGYEIKDDLKTKTSNAFKKGVFGAPTFIVGSKMFFGQDRLEFVFREAKK